MVSISVSSNSSFPSLVSELSTKVHFANFFAPSPPDFETSTGLEFGSSNKLQTVSTLLLIWSRFSCTVRALSIRSSDPVSSMRSSLVIESFLHCRHSTNSTSFDFGPFSSVGKFLRNSRRCGILLFTVFTIFIMESITILQCSMFCLHRFASRCRRFRRSRSIVDSNIVLNSDGLRRLYSSSSWNCRFRSRKFVPVSWGSVGSSLLWTCSLASSKMGNTRSDG